MKNNFPSICRYIVGSIGEPNANLAAKAYVGAWMPYDTPCICYQDNVLEIVAATDSLAIHLVKKDNNNPVLAVDQHGKVYRWHGEAYYLQDHLYALLQVINNNIKIEIDKFNENRRKWQEGQ